MLRATKSFEADFNGHVYQVKKGGQADGLPKVLLSNLMRDGLVKEARTTKKEQSDD